jgi:hypothetical protein
VQNTDEFIRSVGLANQGAKNALKLCILSRRLIDTGSIEHCFGRRCILFEGCWNRRKFEVGVYAENFFSRKDCFLKLVVIQKRLAKAHVRV